MSEKVQVGIIGLGKFGSSLGRFLAEKGCECVGVDTEEERVKDVQDLLTQVYVADVTNKTSLEQIGVADLPHVVVSVGQSMETSIIIALNLKDLGARNIWVKANSLEHERILQMIGVNHVIFPERDAAMQLSLKLTEPGLIQFLQFAGGVSVREVEVHRWKGKTLRDLDLINKHRLQVVATKAGKWADYSFIPHADKVLEENEILVILGPEESFSQVDP